MKNDAKYFRNVKIPLSDLMPGYKHAKISAHGTAYGGKSEQYSFGNAPSAVLRLYLVCDKSYKRNKRKYSEIY